MRAMLYRLSLLAMVLVLGIGLAACGKRSTPVAPPDEPNEYPKTYPKSE